MSNAMLVTAVHVNIKIETIPLNNERLSLINSPYFTILQYINNLETKRSYKRKVNLKLLKFFTKCIERFKNYLLSC